MLVALLLAQCAKLAAGPFLPAEALATAAGATNVEEGFDRLIPPLPQVLPTVSDYTDYPRLSHPEPAYFSRRASARLSAGDLNGALTAAYKIISGHAPSGTVAAGWATVANLELRARRFEAAEAAARRAVGAAAHHRLGVRPFEALLNLVLDIRRRLELDVQEKDHGSPSFTDALWCADEPSVSCKVDECHSPRAQRACRRTCGHCGWGAVKKPWQDTGSAPTQRLDLKARCDVAHVDAQHTNASVFMAQYVAKGIPARISGLLDVVEWARAREWVQALQSPGRSRPPVEQYFFTELASAITHARNTYINLDAKPRDPRVRQTILSGYDVPPYFVGDTLRSHCPSDLPKRWVLFGAAGSGSRHHVDPLNTSAWNALLLGSKRWALYPPSTEVPPGLEKEVPVLARDHDYFAPEHPFARDMGYWGVTAPWQATKTHPAAYFDTILPRLSRSQQPLECMQRAGDVMFVPSGWWHAVLNIDHTVAITENFATSVHIEQVLKELDRRPRHVDREATATGQCASQLRAQRVRSELLENSATTPVTYSPTIAPALVSAPHALHLLLFDGCGPGEPSADTLALQQAASAAIRKLAADILLVRMPCGAVGVRALFGLTSSPVPTLRAATLRGTLFKYVPPPVHLDRDTIEVWAHQILSGHEKPYLDVQDRKQLAQMMRASYDEL